MLIKKKKKKRKVEDKKNFENNLRVYTMPSLGTSGPWPLTKLGPRGKVISSKIITNYIVVVSEQKN